MSGARLATGEGSAEYRIGLWLLLCAFLVLAMVILGGVTRLTQSGLAIVEWQPITGVVPPLGEEAWDEAFTKYRDSPEYRLRNPDMTLAQYRAIYWIEYAHRLLGRVTGLVFALPLLYLLLSRRISPKLARVLAALLVLGAAQGALGWFMVRSGLVDRPEVSHYRLAAHLGLAVVLYGALLWLALGLLKPGWRRGAAAAPAILRRAAAAASGFLLLVILSGGMVAGLDAGFGYNTFPLMADRLVPEDLFSGVAWWRDFFEDAMTVQFVHRLLGLGALVLVAALWLRLSAADVPPQSFLWRHLLLAAIIVQVALGILTLLLVVPTPLAATHQAGAMVALSVGLVLTRTLWPGHDSSGRGKSLVEVGDQIVDRL
jgi:cytochrome c oxidase assembly protein subunit 15